ncbi:unnamed protein product [Urochloa decumbens]|uniref:RRM domain-containing protein n=1 Tax=Urochloa decumbens TaxID=240449 RepID=A0ABC9GCZ8_9POAL
MSSPSTVSPGIRFQAPPLRSPPDKPPLPPALLPPKKRWAWLSPNPTTEATDPVPISPPAVVVSQTIHSSAAIAAVNPLPPPGTKAANAAASSPAAGQKCSSPLQPLAGAKKPNATVPLSRKKPKVVRKVRKFAVRSKVFGPKETTDATEAAPAPIAVEPFPLQGAATVEAEAEEEEQEPGEFIPDKPIADGNINAVPAIQSLMDEEKSAAAGEEEAAGAGSEQPVPEKTKLVMMSSEEAGGDSRDGETATFGLEEMKMREVFVGLLHRDAKEADVRAGLAEAEAGEVTYVRVLMHAKMKKKNRGYCFVRFCEPAAVTRAIAAAEQGNVKICGKPCRIEALDSSKLRIIAQRDPFEDHTCIPYREKRPLSTLGGNSSYCMNRNPRARNGSNAYAAETSSFVAMPPHAIGGYSPLYPHGSIMYLPDSNFFGLAEPWGGIPMRQSGSHRLGQPHGSKH